MKSILFSLVLLVGAHSFALQNCNPNPLQVQEASSIAGLHLYRMLSAELVKIGGQLAADPNASLTIQYTQNANLFEVLFLKFRLADNTPLRADFNHGKTFLKVAPDYDQFGNFRGCNFVLLANTIEGVYNNETNYKLPIPLISFAERWVTKFGPNAMTTELTVQ